MTKQRTVFYISDRTGITAEMLGRTLLTQFRGTDFKTVSIPFVDTLEKAQDARLRIDMAAREESNRPLVFSTLIHPEIRLAIAESQALVLDLFEMFIQQLESELGEGSSYVSGLSHGISDKFAYSQRMDAVNFTLNHDDGISSVNFDKADVILLGVSRSGKTPTCLYLAMQYGIRAANYPLTPDDFHSKELPKVLQPYCHKLFGLTINPERLSQIRNERKPSSQYSAPENCLFEVKEAEKIYRTENIPFLDTTNKSVEEIAVTILHEAKLRIKTT